LASRWGPDGPERLVQDRHRARQERQPVLATQHPQTQVIGAPVGTLRQLVWAHVVSGCTPIVAEVVYDPDDESDAHACVHIIPEYLRRDATLTRNWQQPQAWYDELDSHKSGNRHRKLRNEARRELADAFTVDFGDFSHCLPPM
jgi:hypothetical protein